MRVARVGMVRFLLAAAMLALTAAVAQNTTGKLGEASPAADWSAYPWFYLRDGQPLAADEAVVELIAVGDVMLGRGVTEVPDPLAAVAPWLRTVDLTMGNLESAIADSDWSPTPRTAGPDGQQPIILNAPAAAVSHLANAGFDLLSLANNHTLDYGPEGLAQTAARLQARGITPIGAGPGADAYRPVIRQVNGLQLAFLAFNAVPEPGDSGSFEDSGRPVNSEQWTVNSGQSKDDAAAAGVWQRAEWDGDRAVMAVRAVRPQVDAVIVSVHWGYEYEPRADPWQEAAAQALLAAGADLIIGHHPHVVQNVYLPPPAASYTEPMENTRRTQREQEGNLCTPSVNLCVSSVPSVFPLVAYSLGNFVFDQNQGETAWGLALRVFLDKQGLRAVQALPIWAGLQPRLMTPSEASSRLARIQPEPPRLAFACRDDACYPVEATGDTTTSGLFWSGAIDLTGDGQLEIVRRAGEQVTIYREGTAVWQSPAPWRVVDVALGDPNDDGRNELFLVLWRADPDGFERSQPYIIGYRGGEYKLLWGGRPVTSPILEVELGDVNGDGVQELVVLEDQGDTQSIAVWRWQGWSFSLVWRSPHGHYRNLVLLESSLDPLVLIRVIRGPDL